MKAVVITADAPLARMLSVNLGARGVDVFATASVDDLFSQKPNITFIDAALYEKEKLPDGCDVVIFGWRRDIERLNGECDYQVYERPFDVSETLDETVGKPTFFADGAKKKKYASDGIRLHASAHGATYHGEHVNLSKKEFMLLSLLIEKKGTVVSREEATKIFGGGDTNVVDVYVKYLRKKIDERFGIKLITSVRGKGYSIKAE